MSGYEVEHNIKPTEAQSQPPRRPDLSTFFSALNQVDTTGDRRPQNEHAVPEPHDIAATYRTLAHAFEMMQGGRSEETGPTPGMPTQENNPLLSFLVESLMQSAEDPPREIKGVPDSFLDELERVPKSKLKEDDSCPICSNPFLEDKYPLVVKLPCHGGHRFDLDCIAPWLKLNPTCPMDRQKLVKSAEDKEKERQKLAEMDDEEEFDDMYA